MLPLFMNRAGLSFRQFLYCIRQPSMYEMIYVMLNAALSI
jgi:hypothetical protein